MSARRCLFGRPSSEQRARTRAWLDNALKKQREQESLKWGFDFELGMPLPNHSVFDYNVIPESHVPEFYRNKVLTVDTTTATLDLKPSSLTPLSSPSTSDKDASLLAESNSSFEEEENLKSWKFSEPPTPRKSPTKRRQQKMTDFYVNTKKKSPSLSPSPKNTIYTRKAQRPTNFVSPY